jgi:hypothetical protein
VNTLALPVPGLHEQVLYRDPAGVAREVDVLGWGTLMWFVRVRPRRTAGLLTVPMRSLEILGGGTLSSWEARMWAAQDAVNPVPAGEVSGA